MTYGLGIKGEDKNFGKYVVVASDSRSVPVDKTKGEPSNDAYKMDKTKGENLYFFTQAGTVTNAYTPRINFTENQLIHHSNTRKNLETNLNEFNEARAKETGIKNNYIIGTHNLELYQLNGKKGKLKKESVISTIGSGSPWGREELQRRVSVFKYNNLVNMSLQQAIYAAFESEKWAELNTPESVGGHVDLMIKTENNFTEEYRAIELDELYHASIANGLTQKIAANHILKSPINAIKMMNKADINQKIIIAEQIAMSQNSQYAVSVINHSKLNKDLQKMVIPAVLTGTPGFLKVAREHIHPQLRGQLDEAIEEYKAFH